MTHHVEWASHFLALHQGTQPLLLPNPWDRGSAKLLASLGFQALATTSSGFAATLGRHDGSVTRQEALEHAARLVQATDLPVTADLENGVHPSGGHPPVAGLPSPPSGHLSKPPPSCAGPAHLPLLGPGECRLPDRPLGLPHADRRP
jgi:hypothetical protein